MKTTPNKVAAIIGITVLGIVSFFTVIGPLIAMAAIIAITLESDDNGVKNEKD